jgi:hypothetical protein
MKRTAAALMLLVGIGSCVPSQSTSDSNSHTVGSGSAMQEQSVAAAVSRGSAPDETNTWLPSDVAPFSSTRAKDHASNDSSPGARTTPMDEFAAHSPPPWDEVSPVVDISMLKAIPPARILSKRAQSDSTESPPVERPVPITITVAETDTQVKENSERSLPAPVPLEVRVRNEDSTVAAMDAVSVDNLPPVSPSTRVALSPPGFKPALAKPLSPATGLVERAEAGLRTISFVDPPESGLGDGEPGSPGVRIVGTPVRVVRSRRISLNFALSDIGPSGVSAVELWYTRDGKEWALCDGVPKSPPYLVEVDEEGKYGFTLLARSGAGLSKKPPAPGDEPQIWVIVESNWKSGSDR